MKPIINVIIRWSKRGGRVTSLTGGHTAQFLDLGDEMQITIMEDEKRESKKPVSKPRIPWGSAPFRAKLRTTVTRKQNAVGEMAKILGEQGGQS